MMHAPKFASFFDSVSFGGGPGTGLSARAGVDVGAHRAKATDAPSHADNAPGGCGSGPSGMPGACSCFTTYR
jgi:hypothetical protein